MTLDLEIIESKMYVIVIHCVRLGARFENNLDRSVLISRSRVKLKAFEIHFVTDFKISVILELKVDLGTRKQESL